MKVFKSTFDIYEQDSLNLKVGIELLQNSSDACVDVAQATTALITTENISQGTETGPAQTKNVHQLIWIPLHYCRRKQFA